MKEHVDKKAKDIEHRLKRLKGAEVEQPKAMMKGDKAMGERAFAEIVGGMLFGVITGWLLDDAFNSRPLFLIIMIILGLAGSIYSIYKAFEKQAGETAPDNND